MTKLAEIITMFEKKFEVGLLALIFIKTFIIMGNVSKDPAFFSVLEGLTMVLLFVLLLTKKWSKLEWWVLAVGTPLFVLTYYNSKDGVLLWSFLIIMLSIGVSKSKIMTSFLSAALIKNLMTFILSFFGLYTPFTQIKPGTDIIRYTFGFAHANTIHLFCFAMIAAYVGIRKEKIKKIEILILFGLNVILFYYTFSRTSTMLIMLLLMVSWLLTFRPFNIEQYSKVIFKWASILTFAVALLVMLLSGIYHLSSNQFIEVVNSLLSRRIEQANWYLMENGVSFIGRYIPELFIKENMLFVLDNGYMRVLIQYGLLPFICLMWCLYLTVKKLFLSNNYYELSIILISSVVFILENYLGFVFINISLIYISIIFEKNRKVTYSPLEVAIDLKKIKKIISFNKN